MTGIELIAKEREEQLTKHNRSVVQDVISNNIYELTDAASTLIMPDFLLDEVDQNCPEGWDETIWQHMINKSYLERLITGGALIAAEIDRVKADKILQPDYE